HHRLHCSHLYMQRYPSALSMGLSHKPMNANSAHMEEEAFNACIISHVQPLRLIKYQLVGIH
ncbi:hypothetical protein, partial [Brucella grignonensis]|uniref:hypothetical protein n=1 Tax=Brucella grignonensis TaxID=94627 RepID=UPI0035BBD1B0